MIRKDIKNLTSHDDSYKWVMLMLVWLLYFCFGLTLATIAPLTLPIMNELDISYAQMGFILGAWQLVYIFTAYPLGVIIDKLSIRKSLGIGILLIWISLISRGLAGDFSTLLFAVVVFGFGGPIISIGAPKVISVWFKGSQRNLSAGIYATGPTIGSALALGTAIPIANLLGSWRGISVIYGIIVFFSIILWLVFSKNNFSGLDDKDSISAFTTFRDLFSIRNVKIIMLLAIASFFLNHGLNNWLPTLLKEKGISLTSAGVWSSISMLSGVVGLIIIPAVAKYFSRVLILFGIFIISSSSTFALIIFTDYPLYFSLIISSIVRAPMMPLLTLLLMETKGVGSVRMGAAGGLLFTAAEIGGFAGPFILGVIRDRSGTMDLGLILLGVFIALLVLLLPIIKEN
ncbi:MAG: MFS transporter [Chloroflexi bacterium]|nr:MFS transporter [Chloroflexota bacterium]|tara:strand:+ start:8106 stop:9308 length:1203 start_codon:yes stop_codon:yes gene_type:complete